MGQNVEWKKRGLGQKFKDKKKRRLGQNVESKKHQLKKPRM